MNYAQKAKSAFSQHEFKLAIHFYELAIIEHPQLSHLYLFNLNLARKKLGLDEITIEALPWEATTPTPIFDSEIATSAPPLNSPQSSKFHCTHAPKPNSASIIITAHNAAKYIEESVTSALRQDWPELEVIVIDDHSSDETWQILRRLERSVQNLRCRRLNIRSGLGFSINYALHLAAGEFIILQRGTDFSHPQRVRLQIKSLLDSDAAGVVTNCVAFSSDLDKNSLSSDSAYDPSAVSLCLRQRTITVLGFFNCISAFAEHEFYLRLEKLAHHQQKSIIKLNDPLYHITDLPSQNTEHWSPLTSLNSTESCKESLLTTLSYRIFFEQQHEKIGLHAFSDFYRFPAIRPLTDVPRELCCLPDPARPVIVSLCTIPERIELLRHVLKSLAPQVDALHIYLDRYDSVPDFVRNCHPQVTVYLSKDHPGLRDNGKFLAFSTLAEDCYYFTADDDIIYPPDYVASMVRRIEDYERQAVIGVHGVLLPEQAEGYFTSFRKVHMFKKELERDALVNNLGTGTVAFHSGLLHGLDLTHFGTPGMADLHLSVFCKQRDIPMVALARPEDWLQELPSPNTSLYNEFRQADDQQSALIRAHKPWGYAAISKAVAGALMRATKPDTGERLQRLIPILHACLK